jgi:two-component system, LuxR family, sensor kinase FixL
MVATRAGQSFRRRKWAGADFVRDFRLERPDGRTVVTAVVLAVSYYAGAKAGFALTPESYPVSMLWPPNALVLAALLLSPPSSWAFLIATVFPAHLVAELAGDVPLSMVCCWYVSNVSEALIGAVGIRRYLGGAPSFVSFRDFVVFLTWGVLVAPFVSSFLDAAFVAAVGWHYVDYWTVWRTRLFSNTLATLTLVPLILIWLQRGFAPLRQATRAEYVEACVLLLGLCITSIGVFLQQHATEQNAVLLYVPLPFLIWAAVRQGVGGVSFCVALVALFAISGVVLGRGPFRSSSPADNALALQVFLIIATISLMLLAISLSELRHARVAALRQGERLQLALAAARMGTWDWDVGSDRIVWSVAKAGTADTQARSRSLSMAELLDVVHADDRVRVAGAISQALEGAQPLDVEFRFRSDAGERWISSHGKLDAQGNVQRMLGVHMDTTERKSEELQMRMQRDQLAHLSRVAMLGELSGALAHELNQPLTAIMTNAQAAHRALKRGVFDREEIAEMLADIIAEDKRAGEVIRRLRALFVRGTIDMRRVSVNECIRDVLALEHSDLIARNVAVDVKLAPHLPAVMADRVQLQQVLLNLIVNACDAMLKNKPGDRLLQISSALNQDGDVEIAVCDRGCGVEDTQKIFEPFFSTKEHGLGLGLAICQTIITTHQGRLWASNNSMRGATLHVALPVAVDRSSRA